MESIEDDLVVLLEKDDAKISRKVLETLLQQKEPPYNQLDNVVDDGSSGNGGSSIYYAIMHLNLKQMEIDVKQLDEIALQNYLIEMQKGKRRELARIISLCVALDKSPKVRLGLRMFEGFLRHLSRSLKNPILDVLVEVGEDDRGFSVADFHAKAYISDILYSGTKQMLYLKEQRGSITKSYLESIVLSGKPLTASFSIKVFSKTCEIGEARKWYPNLILQKMYNLDDSRKDLTIVINGTEIKCHRSVLIAQSPVFYSMLSPEYETSETITGRIVLLEYSQEGISQFVKFMYGFELPDNISPELALELLQLAHKYEVKELDGVLVQLLSNKKKEWYSLGNLMELYYFVRDTESYGLLRAHALTELVQYSSDTIMSCDYYKKLDVEERAKFLGTLFDWKGCNFFG